MASENEVQIKIAQIIEELFEFPAAEVKAESRLYEDLDLDSIDAVDLIVKLQDYVEKRVEPEKFKGVRTIADIVVIVEDMLKNDAIVRDGK